MDVKFSNLQIEELMFKLAILEVNAELRADYGVTLPEIESLLKAFGATKSGVVSFDQKHSAMLIEELNNLIDMAESDAATGGENPIGYLLSMRAAVSKIGAAARVQA